jgi:thiol:disulfide interchange protein DsbC
MSQWLARIALGLSLSALTLGAIATETPAAAVDQETVKARAEALVGSKVRSLKDAPLPGFYEAISDQGIFYVSQDGSYLLWGKLFRLEAPIADLTEESYAKLRSDTFKELEASAIVYPAKDEKHVLTVFTDTSCGYCRKFHDQMAEYNKLGFSVHYLAFPRGGERSPAYGEMESIWCAKDQKKTMDAAQGGSKIKEAKCDNPVAKHYAAGSMIGVRGTPAVYLDGGQQVGGYVAPADLAKIVASQKADAKLK